MKQQRHIRRYRNHIRLVNPDIRNKKVEYVILGLFDGLSPEPIEKMRFPVLEGIINLTAEINNLNRGRYYSGQGGFWKRID